MKKFLNIFFVVLGVIFFIIILYGTYFYVADPLEIKPLIKIFMESRNSANLEVNNPESENFVADKNPIIPDEQERALESVGVDPASLPSEITPEQMSCFEGILGKERVAEIKAGSSPTPAEFFQARSCL